MAAWRNATPAEVLVLDLSAPEADAAECVRAACTGAGIFYVRGHGVPEELVDAAFDAHRRVFALPAEEKLKLRVDANYRGYLPPAHETSDPASQKRGGDTKEGWVLGREIAADDPEAAQPLHGPNQWPPEALVPGYRAAMEAYMAAMTDLGRRLNRLCALALGADPALFERAFERPMATLRLNRYAVASDPGAGVFGAGAHYDYGMLTLLKTDRVPGLQLRLPRSDEWLGVPPIEDTFIVTVGLMLERWSNGVFPAALHRVVNPADRAALAFFFDPSFSTVVEPLPLCCPRAAAAPDRAPRCAPTTAGQFILDTAAAPPAAPSAAA